MPYEIGKNRRVEIEALGTTTVHYFRELDVAGFLNFQRGLQQSVEDENSDTRLARLYLKAYESRVERVEGYTIDGADLMEARPEDWRALVPGDHKVRAVDALIFPSAPIQKSQSSPGPESLPVPPRVGRRDKNPIRGVGR